MTLSQILDLINDIEQRFPVDEWTINEVHIWPLIRYNIDAQLRMPKFYFAVNRSYMKKLWDKLLSYVNGFYRYTTAIIKDSRNNQKMDGTSDVLFLTNMTFRRSVIEGKWYDIYAYPIIEELKKQGKRSFTLELSRGNRYKIPRYNPSKLVEFPRDMNFLFKKVSNVFINQKHNIKLRKFDQFQEYLSSLNLSLSIPDEDFIVKLAGDLSIRADYYYKMIKKVNPEIAIVNGYGSQDGLAFCLACRHAGVISVEIQHGVVTELMPRYGKWLKLPPGGYEILPNIFWCWSDFEVNFINRWAKCSKNSHRAVKGDFFWAKRWINGEYSTIREKVESKIEHIKSSLATSKDILVTLQTPYYEPDWLNDVIANSLEDYFWWIRLHPTFDTKERRSHIRNFFNDRNFYRFNIDGACELPLAPLLINMRVICTAFSSTALDAKMFGIPAVIFHEFGIEHYANEIRSGWMKPGLTPEEFLKAIETQIDYKKKTQSKLDCSKIDKDVLIMDLLKQAKEMRNSQRNYV